MQINIYGPEHALQFQEEVPEYPAASLFEHGQDPALIPDFDIDGVGGFTFSVAGDRLETGSRVRIRLSVAHIDMPLPLKGAVVEHSFERGTRIEVSNRLVGFAAMHLAMSDRPEGGTIVDYGVTLRASRLAPPKSLDIVKGIIVEYAPAYAALYKENILGAVRAAKGQPEPDGAAV